jgi:hypothetical protein
MSVTLYTMSRNMNGHGAEYIKPKDGKINITSHGLGSGIYCLTKESMDKVLQSRTRQGIENDPIYEVTMNHPFHIRTTEEGALLVTFSTTINQLLQSKLKDGKDLTIEWNKISDDVRIQLSMFLSLALSQSSVSDAMKLEAQKNIFKAFATEYRNRTNFVKMPITLFLEKLGFDGVYCHPSSGFDTFTKGSLAFVPYVTDSHENIVVNTFKVNNGASDIYWERVKGYSNLNFDSALKMYVYKEERPMFSGSTSATRPKLNLTKIDINFSRK